MLYPLKFKPVYKSYIWGGRGFKKLGKRLPLGIIAESWEISCHPDGVSIIANGEFKGMPLTKLAELFGRELIGEALLDKDMTKFPLLVKLIDANDRLSVQVHPDDGYASVYENGEYGKNEMWYVISAKPGAKLVYDVVPGVKKESFEQAVRDGRIESCLNFINVFPGDVINIPAGLVHAIGEGIVIAEIQQNSNTTYRVYDYNRVDMYGNKRPLHIEKALGVIDFDTSKRKGKTRGLKVWIGESSIKTHLIANKYFSVEKYEVDGSICEDTEGGRFHVFIILGGKAEIAFDEGTIKLTRGESVLIPAALGKYQLNGHFEALKSYVPDLEKNVIDKLTEGGYTMRQIFDCVDGLEESLNEMLVT